MKAPDRMQHLWQQGECQPESQRVRASDRTTGRSVPGSMWQSVSGYLAAPPRPARP